MRGVGGIIFLGMRVVALRRLRVGLPLPHGTVLPLAPASSGLTRVRSLA